MIIEFSEINIKLVLFILFPIFRRLDVFVNISYIKDNMHNPLFNTFICFLSYNFSGLFFLISVFKMKNVQTKESDISTKDENIYFNNFNQIDILQKKLDNKRKIKNIIYLLSLIIFSFLSFFLTNYFYDEDYAHLKFSLRIFFQITNYSLLSRLMINQKLYRHHFVSYASISILLLIIFIITFNRLKKIVYSMIYYFLFELSFAFYDVLIKRYMILYFKTPYYIMFLEGIINSFLLIIFDLVAYILNPEFNGIIKCFIENIENVGNLFFLFILDIILEFIWNLVILLLIFYYTPCHYFIVEFMSEYAYFIIKVIENKINNTDDNFYSDTIISIIIPICYVFILFFCLVFNEIIILNIFRLDYNTKKRIMEREKFEFDRINSGEAILNDYISDESED